MTKNPTNKPLQAHTSSFFHRWVRTSKSPQRFEMCILPLGKIRIRRLISFPSVAELLSPMALIFTESLSSLISDNGQGRMFGDNRFITGTGNCSIHSIRAFSPTPLPEPLLWGSSWPQEERQPNIYSTYKWQKIAHEILLSCTKVKMTTPNKVAQERADRAKSLQSLRTAVTSHSTIQTWLVFYHLLDAQCLQLITRWLCLLPGLYFGAFVGTSCKHKSCPRVN